MTDTRLSREAHTCRPRSRWRTCSMALLIAVAAAALLVRGVRAQTAKTTDHEHNPLAQLHWRFIGPIGNRAAAIAGEPGNPMVDYVGAASGGIWKTENGGVDWKPVFDHENVSAVGALAVSQSEPNVVWAGTGETFLIRPFYPMGNGVYKSSDSGGHWQHMGLDATGHIGRIVIDPHDAQRVFVCALGQLFKSAPDQGVYRTTDGGKTWQHVLSVGDDTGCSDLAIDPKDPNTLFAGMWPLKVRPWTLDSGGPKGGIYVTHDGGATWHKLAGHGLPAADHPVGKVAVAIAASDPQRVYALVQDTPAVALPLGQRRPHLDAGQPRPLDDAARFLLRALRRLADQPGPPVLPQPELRHLARCRQDVRPAEQRRLRVGRRRQPRPLDRPDQREPGDGRQRRRGLHQPRRQPQLRAHPPADRAGLPRHHRQPGALQRLRQHPGRQLVPRPEQQPAVGRLRRRRSPRPTSRRSAAARAASPRRIPRIPTSSGRAATRASSAVSISRTDRRATSASGPTSTTAGRRRT